MDKIVVTVSIYDAETRPQSFGQLRNAYIRVVNQADNAELTRYDLTEEASTETAMIFGELYRSSTESKFRAVGHGYSSGLAGIARYFGRTRRLNRMAQPSSGTADHRLRALAGRGATQRDRKWNPDRAPLASTTRTIPCGAGGARIPVPRLSPVKVAQPVRRFGVT